LGSWLVFGGTGVPPVVFWLPPLHRPEAGATAKGSTRPRRFTCPERIAPDLVCWGLADPISGPLAVPAPPTETQAMTKKNRYGNRPSKPQRRRDQPPPIARAAPQVREKKPPAQYGRPFIVLEDGNKNTFKYQNGAWVPNETNIAQYRRDSQVKELSQQINSMTRYEVRSPLPAGV
jgi:hypothetical protein